MNNWTEESLRAATVKEIKRLVDMPEGSWDVVVVRSADMPYVFLIYWDVIGLSGNGKRLCRSTGIDKSESAETLRCRLQKAFNKPAEEVALFQIQSVHITD